MDNFTFTNPTTTTRATDTPSSLVWTVYAYSDSFRHLYTDEDGYLPVHLDKLIDFCVCGGRVEVCTSTYIGPMKVRLYTIITLSEIELLARLAHTIDAMEGDKFSQRQLYVLNKLLPLPAFPPEQYSTDYDVPFPRKCTLITDECCCDIDHLCVSGDCFWSMQMTLEEYKQHVSRLAEDFDYSAMQQLEMFKTNVSYYEPEYEIVYHDMEEHFSSLEAQFLEDSSTATDYQEFEERYFPDGYDSVIDGPLHVSLIDKLLPDLD